MRRRRWQQFLYLLADIAVSTGVWLVFGAIQGKLDTHSGYFDWGQVINGLVVSVYWVLVYGMAGLYNKPFRRSRLHELSQVFKYTLFGVLAFFFVIVLDDPVLPFNAFRVTITTYFLLQLGGIGFFRLLITTRTNYQIRNRLMGFPTVVIGSQGEACKIYSKLERMRKSLGFQFVGYVDEKQTGEMDASLPYLGDWPDLQEVVQQHQIEEIIIALERTQSPRLGEVIDLCEQTTANIKIVPGIYDYMVGSVKISHILGAPLIEVFPGMMKTWEKVVKRVFDLGLSFVMLIVLTPVFLLIALGVKLDSPGPIFFRQERIGKGGQPFFIHKFRSMRQDAEKMGPALSSDDDPRITRIGSFLRKMRLDELPQFWNVLKGEMSIVGPRPERQYFIDQITQQAPHYRHLHKIRPGITSWGQVKYGYASTVEEMVERLQFDILYMEQMSLALDVKIILYTLIVILEGRGK